MQNAPKTRITGLPDVPQEILPVVKLELDGPPASDVSSFIGNADVFPDLPK